MIIDFHTHVFPPEDWGNFTGTAVSSRTLAQNKAAHRGPSRMCSKAADIGGVDIYGHQQSDPQSARHGSQAAA